MKSNRSNMDARIKAERRREQNRIAQRNYRKKMREIATKKPQAGPTPSPEITPRDTNTDSIIDDLSETSPASNTSRSIDTSSAHESTPEKFVSITPLKPSSSTQPGQRWPQRAIQKCQLYKLGRSGLQQLLLDIETAALKEYYLSHTLGSPRTDQLLTLIQFNVFRALVSNTTSMGFTMEWLREDAISPWCSGGEGTGIGVAGRIKEEVKCPPSLQPTALQQLIPHHPWIDLFPLPKMRDNLLLADAYYDEDALCNDLVEFCNVTHEKSGLVVWGGNAWDPACWEATETFWKNWGWVLKGCDEIRSSTNYWREKRGELPLRL